MEKEKHSTKAIIVKFMEVTYILIWLSRNSYLQIQGEKIMCIRDGSQNYWKE